MFLTFYFQKMAIKEITSMAQFRSELQSAGDKLVVVDFYAEWFVNVYCRGVPLRSVYRCGPCNQMAPFFSRMARRFTHAVFLKVNVSNLPAVAEAENVSGLPTFAFYIRSRKVDYVRGANRDELERKIVAYVKDFDEDTESCIVPGQEDLMMYVNPKDCECLNEKDDHPFSHCLSKSEAWLESDCDEQLLIFIKFQEMAKLHSFRMKGKDGMGPKLVKVFINLPHCLDFDRALKLEPTESFTLSEQQAEDGEVINVHCVKYQSVHSLQFFVVNNQADSETTRIMELGIYGTPVDIMRMDDFKRVILLRIFFALSTFV
ncbi:Thioredoxin and PITH domain containing protein [Trichuris trichiura]|uniref:Thioredoxin and PITH domain containing protein n=1 Tax=Trichuris trichiura TaxID=36087 RepID=A0A077YX90_TRITR|nr:Thioredoxin and PITH domain containing protein [Trichuris trichiura]